MSYQTTIPFPITFSAVLSLPFFHRRKQCASAVTTRHVLTCKAHNILKKVDISTGDVLFFSNTHYPHNHGVPESRLKVVERPWTVEQTTDESVMQAAEVVGFEGCAFDWFGMQSAVEGYLRKERKKKWTIAGRLQKRDGKPFLSAQGGGGVEHVVVERVKRCKCECKTSEKDEKLWADRVEYDFSKKGKEFAKKGFRLAPAILC